MRPDTSEDIPALGDSQLNAINKLISIADAQSAAHAAGTDLVALIPRQRLPESPAAPPRAEPGPAPEPAPRRARGFPAWPALLLAPVLIGQACLSLRLVWSNTAYQDEALYLWAGKLEWAHWLHGAPIPPFPYYFSGAPVVYPPVAAAFNAIGGLAGARIFSLICMLGATILLWRATRHLFGPGAAWPAAALWALLGPTQRLGAFATFDAMALLLLALAAWSAITAASRRHVARWLIIATLAMLAANAAKYASAIFDPVILALPWVTGCPRPGGKTAMARSAAMVTYLSAGVITLILVAGGQYASGISATTLARAHGQQSPLDVLSLSWQWVGVAIAGGIGGVLLSIAGRNFRRHRTLLLALLAGTALLVPFQQARIHSTTSLDKHVAFGAWFAAIAAGYAVNRLISMLRGRPAMAVARTAVAVALVPVAVAGAVQATSFFSWPDASRFIRILRPLAARHPGAMLIETSSLAQYYLPSSIHWQQWSNTFSITTPAGRSIGFTEKGITDTGDIKTYQDYIKHNYFQVVALNYSTAGTTLDLDITRWLHHDPRYRVAASIPYGRSVYTIWVLRSRPAAPRTDRHPRPGRNAR